MSEGAMEYDRRYQDVLALEGRIGSHEEVCAVRYEGIHKVMDGLERSVQNIDKKLDTLDNKIETNTREIKGQVHKYVIATLVFVIVTLLGISGYLYSEVQHTATKIEQRIDK